MSKKKPSTKSELILMERSGEVIEPEIYQEVMESSVTVPGDSNINVSYVKGGFSINGNINLNDVGKMLVDLINSKK